MNPDKQDHHYLDFGHTRSHFLLRVYVEDPEASASSCIQYMHQLHFCELSTILLLEILKFPFFNMYPEPDNSYLEVCKDHVNNTSALSTIVNTMSLLFLCLSGYIFTNYHTYLEMHIDHVAP